MAKVYVCSWLVCIVFVLYKNTWGEEIHKYPRFHDLELVTRYRNAVDRKIKNGACEQDYNLLAGSSIFQDYSYWNKEIRTANNVANYLTSMWRFKSNNRSLIENEAAIYSLTKTIVLSSEQIYGSVVCFDEDKFQGRRQFCPYAYKNSTGTNRTIIRDLGRSNDYLTSPSTQKNDSKHSFIWWHVCKGFTKTTEQLKQRTVCYDTDLDNPATNSLNVSTSRKYYNITSSYVPIKHGKWTTPYYDCFGGQTWMITYLSPFYDEANTFL